MNEIPAPDATLASGTPSSSLISTTLLVYALFGVGAVAGLVSSGFPLIAPLMGIVGVVALIIAYVKRGEAAGTWLASHLRWLIRTFWFSFLWGVRRTGAVRDSHRHPVRVRSVDRDDDLGALPTGARLHAVQGQQGYSWNVATRRSGGVRVSSPSSR